MTTPSHCDYRTIPLTKDKCALVDERDYEFLSQWKWSTQVHGRTFYAVRADYSIEEAYAAYCRAAETHHGEFSCLGEKLTIDTAADTA